VSAWPANRVSTTLRAVDSAVLVGICGAFVALVAVGVFQTVRRTSLRRRLKRIPITPIANLPVQGVVHVVGIASAPSDRLVAAPFTNRLGVYCYSHMMRGARMEQQLHRHTQFELTDDTGTITIDCEGADVALRDQMVELATVGKSKVFGAGIMSRANEDVETQYFEALIEVGQYVHVIGALCEQNGKRALATRSGQRLLVAPPDVTLT
jgi:hypothetical protein